MRSHEYAAKVKETVDRILDAPDVEVETGGPYLYMRFYQKEVFLGAVRAFGSGKKEYKEDDFTFTPTGTCLAMEIARNKVCRKVKDAVYECEPLLSQEEVDSIGREQRAMDEAPFADQVTVNGEPDRHLRVADFLREVVAPVNAADDIPF